MSYTLLGSAPSPYVRKIRMLMESIPYELQELNIYETQDGLTLNKVNPTNQIPVLMDGDQRIWDSRVIYNYLNRKHKLYPELSIDEENLITAIDGAMTSAINLLLMKRSGMNTDENFMFINRQKERIESVLDFLKPYLGHQGLNEWNFVTISLYTLLDWGVYRNILDLKDRPECQKFLQTHGTRLIVQKTQPPKV